MRYDKQPIDTDQCVRALLGAISSSVSIYAADNYQIVELIKFLQEDPSVYQEKLFRVESA
jgi:hypothetical protein